MFKLRPLYCPNCKELVFLTDQEAPELLEAKETQWQKHGCQKFGDQPLFETDLLQKMLSLSSEEGFAFKYREGGYRGHGAPQQAVVLRVADEHHPYFQLITEDNGLFEYKFSDTDGLVQGQLIRIGKSRRTGNNRFRAESWSAIESLSFDESASQKDLYQLKLSSPEQEALEAHCTRLIKYFEKQGTPVVGIIPLPIDEGSFGRQILISANADVLLGLEKTNLPSQLSYSIQQVQPFHVNEA